ncbi:MAG: ferredoxin [Calditrichaeota bacterium]|nr:ferredoxin [Candidatus Cloacimonadota bacterium]MCA9786437.1 ferredoxin [Candidatus Cloacimonadota bacterium]MCB1046057.1 ferredoxin [Calditrichota bacterium]MCB9473989.1 ferredoxin [Candidatus Delongbacteria bacterium]
MADKSRRFSDNVPGKFYVDEDCICCGACIDAAPNNFRESDSGDHDMVYKQPENDEELKQCRDAIGECPVECIGEDGD